jgi:hypothetical protein
MCSAHDILAEDVGLLRCDDVLLGEALTGLLRILLYLSRPSHIIELETSGTSATTHLTTQHHI